MGKKRFHNSRSRSTHRAPRFSTGSLRVMALATETPSLVILGPPNDWPASCQRQTPFPTIPGWRKKWLATDPSCAPSLQQIPTDDNSAALGAESGLDSLGEGVNTLQHALAGVVAKDNILGTKVAASGGLRVEQARGTGERSARASKHCGDVGNAFCRCVRKRERRKRPSYVAWFRTRVIPWVLTGWRGIKESGSWILGKKHRLRRWVTLRCVGQPRQSAWICVSATSTSQRLPAGMHTTAASCRKGTDHGGT